MFLSKSDLRKKYEEDNSGFQLSSKGGFMDYDITPHEKLVIDLEKKYNVLTLDYEKVKCELDICNSKLISILEQNKLLQDEIEFLTGKLNIEKKTRERLELEAMNETKKTVKSDLKEFLKNDVNETTEETTKVNPELKKTVEKLKVIPKITPKVKRTNTLPVKHSEKSEKKRWQ